MSKKNWKERDLEINDFNGEFDETYEDVNAKSVSKKGKFNIASAIMIMTGVICIGVAVWGIVGIITEYQQAVDRYNEIENEFVQIHTPENNEVIVDTETTESEAPVPQVPWYELVSVDLAGIQKKYSDVVGWIFFENQDISYPVLQGDEIDTYLYKTYDGQESKSGSIFIDSASSPDFSDTHTFVYGHNMKNLSMFGKLKYYKTKDGYYDDHKYIQIFSGNEILRYQIFTYQEASVDSFVYTETHTSARVLANRLASTSMIDVDLEITDSDKIITLSTCTAEDDYRFIVNAVLIDRYTISE